MSKTNVNKLDIVVKVSEETSVNNNEIINIWKHQYKKLSDHIHNVNDKDFELTGVGKIIQKHKPEEKIDLLKDFEL